MECFCNIYLGGTYTSVTIDPFAHSQTVLLRGSHLILKIQENQYKATFIDCLDYTITLSLAQDTRLCSSM